MNAFTLRNTLISKNNFISKHHAMYRDNIVGVASVKKWGIFFWIRKTFERMWAKKEILNYF
jgi:hypothetical protein